MNAVMCMFTPRLNRPRGCLDRSASAYRRGTVGKREMKGVGVDNGGPVRSLCVCLSYNHGSRWQQQQIHVPKGRKWWSKGHAGGKEAALCFVGSSHKGRVRKCYGNVIGFEDFGYMEMWCRINNGHKANQPIRYFMWFEQWCLMAAVGVSVLRK